MNGFTLLALIVLALGVVVAYRAGGVQARRAMRAGTLLRPAVVAAPLPAPPATAAPVPATLATHPPSVPADPSADPSADPLAAERFRIALGYEADAHAWRRAAASESAHATHGRALDEDRRGLQRSLAQAREETARYRQVLIDIENNAPPPLLDGPGAPDDLKLIVGVGPVLERMLQQLGVTTYRQIAHWSEREIGEFDARLPEFHGRVRRDEWVKQARELHRSKYGEPPAPPRG